jgi:hypothetical protein
MNELNIRLFLLNFNFLSLDTVDKRALNIGGVHGLALSQVLI